MKIPDGIPPWLESIKAKELALSNAWSTKSSLRQKFLEDFIRDCLHSEISVVVSGTLTERQTRHKGEAKVLRWLNQHVITEKMYDLVTDVAWEALWDQARKLKKHQIFQLEKNYKHQTVITLIELL